VRTCRTWFSFFRSSQDRFREPSPRKLISISPVSSPRLMYETIPEKRAWFSLLFFSRGSFLLMGLGGKLESFHYACGDTDVFIIACIPDAKSAAAVSLAVNAAGGEQVTTTPLLTPKEMHEAFKKSVRYRPPGS